MSTGKKIILILATVLILAVAVTLLVCSYSYSEGNSAGVLLNFSKRGLLFKTYEGKLNMGGMGNVPNTAQMNDIWDFSVKDQIVADSLSNLGGRKVSLHYREVVKNLPWQGETKYFVDKVTVIN